MKRFLLIILTLLLITKPFAQIITPQVKAKFGIDADLNANYFNGSNLAGNDDWYKSVPGTGISVIDTTGAAAILANYNSNVSSRYNTIIRNMSYPSFSEVNGVLLMDAVFVRDFHADDSTMFAAGSNKNGQNPSVWSSPSAQSVPDKNEILDVFMHVRRSGLTAADSLWMFGAVSIENTTGNRYFDFEMYQSDITFNYSTRTFTGYGPDDGHTSWQFDAGGNITKAGDIILTAEYSSSALTFIEARIWIDKSMLLITPANFSWSGQFDGANSGAQFGYASILPKINGAYYSGLQSDSNVNAGPFKLVRANNSLVDNYTERQFMEFSVNLTKLGLDPVTILGGSTCDKPFQKVLVKSRASTSFTAALKDFVAPFEFFKAPRADLFTTIPLFCGVYGVSNIVITNPIPTSLYTWSTIGGRFADSSNKTSVFVDRPGLYLVHQQLRTTCPLYATDTLNITFDSTCGVLTDAKLNFTAVLSGNKTLLSWRVNPKQNIYYYVVESSTDGVYFSAGDTIYTNSLKALTATTSVENANSNYIYFRLRIVNTANAYRYSPTIKLALNGGLVNGVALYPNPVKDMFSLNFKSPRTGNVHVDIYDENGKLMRSVYAPVTAGKSSLIVANLSSWHKGVYTVKILLNNQVVVKRMFLGN